VTARTYAENGLPWFDLYDDHMGDISAPAVLGGIKTVKEMDAEKGLTSQQDDESIEIPEDQIVKYEIDPDEGIKDNGREERRTSSSGTSKIAAAANRFWQRLRKAFGRR